MLDFLLASGSASSPPAQWPPWADDITIGSILLIGVTWLGRYFLIPMRDSEGKAREANTESMKKIADATQKIEAVLTVHKDQLATVDRRLEDVTREVGVVNHKVDEVARELAAGRNGGA